MDEITYIDRYLAGEATAEERAWATRWLADPAQGYAHALIADTFRAVCTDVRTCQATPPVDLDLVVARLQARRLAAAAGATAPTSRRMAVAAARGGRGRAGGGMRRWPLAAFALTVASVVAIGVTRYAGSRATSLSAVSSAGDVTEYHARAGQSARVQLRDGSLVLLAPESSLRVPEQFGAATRDVELRGEALFTVTRASGVPFTVHTPAGAVHVLGTAFTVRQYDTDRAIRVVVAEGKVSLAGTVLVSGEMATREPGLRPIVSHAADLTAELGWTAGRLTFEDAPLRDVLPSLKRWYGLTVRADRALLDSRITTVFQITDSHSVSGKLAALLEARASYAGDTLVLTRR